VPDSYYTGAAVVRLWDLTPIMSMLRDPVAVACDIIGGDPSIETWRRTVPELPYQQIC
jgi:hypothetical protein